MCYPPKNSDIQFYFTIFLYKYKKHKNFYYKFTDIQFFDRIKNTMKQINLETKINLYSKTILSDYNYFLIQELYMPIVGSDGVSLYTLFSNRIKMGKKSVNFDELTAYLCISLNDVLNAKKKLEAVGLISTYSNSSSDVRELSVILYSPKSPKKFFLDIVLKGLLQTRIGEEKVREIKEYFKMDSLDKNSLTEDSANFIDVFSVDFDNNNFKYDSEKNEILFDFKSKDSTLKFDFAFLLFFDIFIFVTRLFGF
jgi:replication initiation and membrane attachment protein